jgi:glycosyltransferase involved in cell wall biosynthesis
MAPVVSEPPTVGVVTPALNSARFLRGAVDSVLAQDYPHVDYLVMDGGSRDGTRELLAGYGERVRWMSAPDAGQADAVSRGWGLVRGEIVAYLNADDAYKPGAIAAAVEGIGGHGLVYGEGELVDEAGAPLGRYPTTEPTEEALAGQCPICQPTAFVRRDALERTGGLDRRLHFAFDYDLWIRLCRSTRARRLARAMAVVGMRRDNKTLGSRGSAYREAVSVAKRHFGYVPLSWIEPYAMNLADGSDGFFVPHRRSRESYALALAMGLRHNPRQARRFWREWAFAAGMRPDFTGRWEDGWISRLHVSDHPVPEAATRLRVAGRHHAYLEGPLRLRARVGGLPVARLELAERGPFELTAPLPEAARGHTVRLTLEAEETWIPREGGDRRRLGCLIDAIEFD